MPIKTQFSKSLIFGLKARPPIGIILGFVGYRHKVMPIMQTLCHGTRAYILNSDANKLSGFIRRFDIVKMLFDADKKDQLIDAKEW